MARVLAKRRSSPPPLSNSSSTFSLDSTSSTTEDDDFLLPLQTSTKMHYPSRTTRSLDDDLSYQDWGSISSPTKPVDILRRIPYRVNQLFLTIIKVNWSLRPANDYILVAAVCGVGLIWYWKSHASLHSALQQVLQLQKEHSLLLNQQFRSVETDLRQLSQAMMELNQMEQQRPLSASQPQDFHDAELYELQQRLNEGSTQISALQKHLQWVSQQDALQKYGSGKIRVQLELEFPRQHHLKEDSTKDKTPVLILEMAPLEKMPHSVYLFLEMVRLGLYDGCSFILNALHVIKAAPLPYDGSSAAAKIRQFASHNLEGGVAFKEYSPDFPHAAYTIGFAADESPSFYINTQDNSDVHIGEPCFAKIVSGIEVVKRMEQAPTRNGIWFRQR
eukprot:CAMPEP_0176137066 /NCGR_PEP_ID=MMETSP0120_2-20121206/69576_1 /TAXON_ID=160619 /ORGANISM="Kryptoperidinium foliaceum, Strain CCMP 1326" /LENGTH=388 /DNA_ID=CAMNT_0017472885 /DNA_START=30 /DNA_END=1194 /DNA_ORIENTATION=-